MKKSGCYVKKRGKRKKLLIAFFILVTIVAGVWVFIAKNVNPMILMISNEKVKAMTADAVSRAVLDVMAESGSMELMSISRGEDNSIKSVDINSDKVTELAQKITIDAQKKINEVGRDGIKIPLGSLSGVTLFTGLGPDVNIKTYLVGSTQTKITSTFSESGINQTLHSLYLDITGSVAVAIPGLPSTIETTSHVLMSEMIIVGSVPETYLRSTNIGDMLDLAVK